MASHAVTSVTGIIGGRDGGGFGGFPGGAHEHQCPVGRPHRPAALLEAGATGRIPTNINGVVRAKG
jgi:hypothetical protein